MPPKQTCILKKCCILTCGVNSAAEPSTIFFPLPDPVTQQDRLQRWLAAIARPDLAAVAAVAPAGVDGYFVCQRHFQTNPENRWRRPEILDPTQELPTQALPLGPQPGPSAPPPLPTPTLPQPTLPQPRLPQPTLPQPRSNLKKPSNNIVIYNLFAEQQSKKRRKQSYRNFKDFCLNLYQCCALQYKSLRESLKLLPVGALRCYARRAAAEPGADTRLLALKARHMPPRLRACTMCLGNTPLAPGFYYNIRDDAIVGVGESESEQQAGKAAVVAAVATLQGLQADWRLPLARTQLAELQPEALLDWLDVVEAKLPPELALHALVAPLEPLYYRAARLRGVSEDDPHFELNGTKVCFLFDPASVMQNVRYHLTHSKIFYKNKEVKWMYIDEYFNLSQSFKMQLTPNLTESEIMTEKETWGSGGGEALRPGVARAMSVLAQLGHLSAGAALTADFLAGINDALDLCSSRHCSAQNSRKRPYSGEYAQTLEFENSLDFFNEIRLVESHDVDLEANFLNAFKINLSSIQCLHSDLQSNAISHLSTHRLSNCTDVILKQIEESVKRKGVKDMTSRHFVAAFNGVFVEHYMRPNSVVASERKISKFVGLLESGLVSFKPPVGVLVGWRPAKCLVTPRLYRALRPPAHPETYLAGFILGYCLERHQTCPAFRLHIRDCCVDKDKCLKQQDFFTVSGYENTWKNLKYGKEYVIDPPVRFLEFLQRLEMVFREAASRGGLAPPLMESLEDAASGVTLPDSHCGCFPVFLAKTVFLRLRLCLTLRHNNAALREGKLRNALSTDGVTFNFVVSRFKTVICD